MPQLLSSADCSLMPTTTFGTLLLAGIVPTYISTSSLPKAEQSQQRPLTVSCGQFSNLSIPLCVLESWNWESQQPMDSSMIMYLMVAYTIQDFLFSPKFSSIW